MGVASDLTFCIKRLLTRGEKRFVTERLGGGGGTHVHKSMG